MGGHCNDQVRRTDIARRAPVTYPRRQKDTTRINESIRAREVRVISPEGEQLGILPISQALAIAEERDLSAAQADKARRLQSRLQTYLETVVDPSPTMRRRKNAE